MKLGILCTMTNGFGKKGFYNTQEIGLGRALWKKGHQVVIYKLLTKGEKADRIQLGDGFEIQYLAMPSFGAHGIMKTSVIDPNLNGLLCFADNQLFLPHVYRYCMKHKITFVPYIGTTHSLYSNLKGKISDFIFKNGTMKIYFKHPVLAKTTGARAELRKLGINKVKLAPVGLDDGVLHTEFRSEDRAAIRKEFGITDEDAVVICNVARLEPEKRPLELVELFERIKDQKNFYMIIVGNGQLEEKLKEQITEKNLQDRIKLISSIPYADMWKLYKCSDYYVNMNKGEIFGMAIMEAVYYQTSVAAYTAPGPRLTLKDMPGHKLCASDEEIEKWLTAPYPTEEELAFSSEKMIHDFSWNRCAEAFISLVR